MSAPCRATSMPVGSIVEVNIQSKVIGDLIVFTVMMSMRKRKSTK